MKKLSSNKKNAMQLLMMIFLTCLSQVIALYKSRFTAVNFGASDYMDAYNFALNIATFVFAFITTGVTTVVIPAYVKKSDRKAVDSFITIIYISVIIIIGLVLFFRIPLTNVLTNRGDDFTAIVGDFLFVTFLIQGISAFLAVTTGYFQSINKYTTPKMILLLSNLLVAIALILGLVNDIEAYLGLLVLGALVSLVFDVVIAIVMGFRFKPTFDLKNEELHKMLHVFLPTLFSSGVYKIHTMVDTTIATSLAEGQVTILSYSTQIITMVNSVIVGNLTVYAYPKIIAQMEKEDSKRAFWDYVIFFHAAVVLLVVGFFNIGKEGVTLLFYGGKFTMDDVTLLYICTCVYIFGQQFNIVRDLIYRYFYAKGNTKDTLKNSVFVSITNICLCLILVQFWGVIGIILGTVLSSLISLCMIMVRFKKAYGLGIGIKGILVECGKNIIAMVVSVVIVMFLKSVVSIKWDLLAVFIYGIITVVIYVLMLLLLKTRVRHIKF